MPRTKKTDSATAATMFEQLPAGKLQKLVAAAIAKGDGIMFGQTRSGKAAIINIYSEEGKERAFADSTEELVNIIEDLTLDYLGL